MRIILRCRQSAASCVLFINIPFCEDTVLLLTTSSCACKLNWECLFLQKHLLCILRQKKVINRSTSKKQVLTTEVIVWFLGLLAYCIMLQHHINRSKIISCPCTSLQGIALCKQSESASVIIRTNRFISSHYNRYKRNIITE